MVSGPVITVVSRARPLPPTVTSRPPVELLRRPCRQLHGVHERRHDGLVLGRARGLGSCWRRLRLVRLRRQVTSSLPVVSLGLEATRSASPALAPGPKCLWSQVGPGTIGWVLAVRPRQVWAVHHGVPGSLAPCRHRAVPWQAGELLPEQRRLLVQEILLSCLVSGARPGAGH